MADQGFFDDFYNETMTEMAGNFFSRRKDMDARLDGFRRLGEEVRSIGKKALRRWKSLFILLGDDQAAVAFFRRWNADISHVPALADAVPEPWRFRPASGFTAQGRYRKSVRHVYEAVQQATTEYVEGGYANDPRNPKKKIITPSYTMLLALSKTINKEVEHLNATHNPSMVLAYCKSLNPGEMERENITGGLSGENYCKIDDEMAFKPVDFQAMELPVLPLPEPLEKVRDDLDRMADQAFKSGPERARQALSRLTLG